MPDEDPLALENRRRVFDHAAAHPGMHVRGLQRALGMSPGTLEYHLRVLVREGLLVERRQGRYLRYYVAAQVGREEKDVLGLLRQQVPRGICAQLLLRPDQSHGELLAHFRIAPSTLSFHLKKLVTGGLVESRRDGRETRFRVRDPDLVGKVLVAYRASFLDDLVDRFADVWLGGVGAGLEERGTLAGGEAPDDPDADGGARSGGTPRAGERAGEPHREEPRAGEPGGGERG